MLFSFSSQKNQSRKLNIYEILGKIFDRIQQKMLSFLYKDRGNQTAGFSTVFSQHLDKTKKKGSFL